MAEDIFITGYPTDTHHEISVLLSIVLHMKAVNVNLGPTWKKYFSERPDYYKNSSGTTPWFHGRCTIGSDIYKESIGIRRQAVEEQLKDLDDKNHVIYGTHLLVTPSVMEDGFVVLLTTSRTRFVNQSIARDLLKQKIRGVPDQNKEQLLERKIIKREFYNCLEEEIEQFMLHKHKFSKFLTIDNGELEEAAVEIGSAYRSWKKSLEYC